MPINAVEQIHQTVRNAGGGHNEFTVIHPFPALVLALALALALGHL